MGNSHHGIQVSALLLTLGHALRPPILINIINLDQGIERWRKISDNLEASGVDSSWIHRYSAIYGKNLTKDELMSNTTALSRSLCSPGMIGCFLSHSNLWDKIATEEHPFQVVLEDDAVVCNNFCTRVYELVDELETNEEMSGRWGALLLGAFGCVDPKRRYGAYRVQAGLLGDGQKPRFLTPHCHIGHRH